MLVSSSVRRQRIDEGEPMMCKLTFGALPVGTIVSPRPDIYARSNAASDRRLIFCSRISSPDARQAQRDSELTEVNAMRKTKSAILDAVHDAAKAMHKAGVTDLVTLPQLRSGISK